MAIESLEGKTALVTGASSGLGRAIAIAFGEQGANLVLNARTQSSLEEVAAIIDPKGERVAIVAGDISIRTQPAVKEENKAAIPGPGDLMVAASKERWSEAPLYVVVHAAGLENNQLFMRQSDDEWDQTYAIKLTGARNVMKPALGVMYRIGQGKLIGLSSAAADRGNFGQSAYTGANRAMEGMMQAIAQEMVQMKKPEIGVKALRLGPVNEGMMLRLKEASPEMYQRIADRMPSGELIPVEAVTSRVLEIVLGDNSQTEVVENFYGGFRFD